MVMWFIQAEPIEHSRQCFSNVLADRKICASSSTWVTSFSYDSQHFNEHKWRNYVNLSIFNRFSPYISENLLYYQQLTNLKWLVNRLFSQASTCINHITRAYNFLNKIIGTIQIKKLNTYLDFVIYSTLEND